MKHGSAQSLETTARSAARARLVPHKPCWRNTAWPQRHGTTPDGTARAHLAFAIAARLRIPTKPFLTGAIDVLFLNKCLPPAAAPAAGGSHPMACHAALQLLVCAAALDGPTGPATSAAPGARVPPKSPDLFTKGKGLGGVGDSISKGLTGPIGRGVSGPVSKGEGVPVGKGMAVGHHVGHARFNATRLAVPRPGVKRLWPGAAQEGSEQFRPDSSVSYGKASPQEAGGSGALLLALLACCLCCLCYRRVRRARELRAAKHAELTDDMEEALERAATEAREQKTWGGAEAG